MTISIEVIPLGPVAVGARAWRHRSRRLLTAIVKATFSINHDGPMTITQPAPVVTEERHFRNNPVASLVRASDLALLVPKPEVVVVGHAHAGPGQKLATTTVRLAVARGTNMLINKRLDIVGDRRAKPGEPPPEPTPFEKMPVLYERALGGIASRENPVGVGMATDEHGLLTLPNVQHPPQGGVNPAGFGPIPSAWPLRQKKRGSLSWSAANAALDVDVPEDFDDAYYQTAPADQQVSELLGGEMIALVNMHPEIGTLRTTIPNLRALAMAQTTNGERIAFPLRIDTVHVQPDMLRAEIVYRGATVISEAQLKHLRLAGAIEDAESSFNFPDLSGVGGLVAGPGARKPATVDLGSTAVITDDAPPAQRVPSAPPRPASTAPPPRGHGGTMVIEPDAPPPPTASPPRPTPEKGPHQSTLVLEPEFEPTSLPFEKQRAIGAGPTAELEKPATAAATPWGEPQPVQIRPAATSLVSTLAMEDTADASGFETLEEEQTLLRGAQLIAPPAVVLQPLDETTAGKKPVSSADLPTPRASDPQGDDAPISEPVPAVRVPTPPPADPSPPAAPGVAPKPAPKANVASDLYKRFKK
jgi:hypothetical protein